MPESRKPRNVTPHVILIAVLAVVLIAVPMASWQVLPQGFFLKRTAGGYGFLGYFIVAFGFIFLGERLLVSWPRYRGSWFCRELGPKDNVADARRGGRSEGDRG